MVTRREIEELERQLNELQKEYMEERPPCMNESCPWWRTGHTNHCAWTVFHDDCKDYKE